MSMAVSPSRVQIREARVSDIDDLVRVEQESFRIGRFSPEQFRYLITRAKGRSWVAVEGTTVLGFVIMLMPAGRGSARIYNVATAKAARGRGIGRSLIERAWQWARRNGRQRLYLEVRQTNRPAIRLYERLGFVRAGALPDYYGEGRHGWRYVREG